MSSRSDLKKRLLQHSSPDNDSSKAQGKKGPTSKQGLMNFWKIEVTQTNKHAMDHVADHAPVLISTELKSNLRLTFLWIILYGFVFAMMLVRSSAVWIMFAFSTVYLCVWIALLVRRWEVSEVREEIKYVPEGQQKLENQTESKESVKKDKDLGLQPVNRRHLLIHPSQAKWVWQPLQGKMYVTTLANLIFPAALDSELGWDETGVKRFLGGKFVAAGRLSIQDGDGHDVEAGSPPDENAFWKGAKRLNNDTVVSLASSTRVKFNWLKTRLTLLAESWELAAFEEFRYSLDEKDNASQDKPKESNPPEYRWHPHQRMENMNLDTKVEADQSGSEAIASSLTSSSTTDSDIRATDPQVQMRPKLGRHNSTNRLSSYLGTINPDDKSASDRTKCSKCNKERCHKTSCPVDTVPRLAFRPSLRGPWMLSSLMIGYWLLTLGLCFAHHSMPEGCEGQALIGFCSPVVQGICSVNALLCCICTGLVVTGTVALPTSGTLQALTQQLQLLQHRNPRAAKIREFVVVNADAREQSRRTRRSNISAYRSRLAFIIVLLVGAPVVWFSICSVNNAPEQPASRKSALKKFFAEDPGIGFCFCMLLAAVIIVHATAHFLTRTGLRGSRRCAYRARYLTFALYWILEGDFLEWEFTRTNSMKLQHLQDLCYSWMEARNFIMRHDDVLEYQQTSNFLLSLMLLVVVAVPCATTTVIYLRTHVADSLREGATITTLFLWVMGVSLGLAAFFMILKPYFNARVWCEEQNYLLEAEIGRAQARTRLNYIYNKADPEEEDAPSNDDATSSQGTTASAESKPNAADIDEENKHTAFVEYLKEFSELAKNMEDPPRILGFKLDFVWSCIKGYTATGVAVAGAFVVQQIVSSVKD
eukprot:m.247306 g.247306  ORF g.247306 m.247306 type:complete len:875 (-) comp22596_c0_seq2:33-2657(-)